MKIIVNKEPIQDIECEFYNNYEVKAEFISSEEATAQDLSNMFFDAMMLEEYLPHSAIKALLLTAVDQADYFDIDFNDILRDAGIIETNIEEVDSNE